MESPENKQEEQQQQFPNTVPIAALSPYLQPTDRWCIKALVTKVGEIKSFVNAKGGGQVISIEVKDETGGEIRITMWNDAVQKWASVFQEGRTYYVGCEGLNSTRHIRSADPKWNRLSHAYEINLPATALVKPAGARDEVVFHEERHTVSALIALPQQFSNATANAASLLQAASESESGKVYTVRADVSGVLGNCEKPPWYWSCPNSECKSKKVQTADKYEGGQVFCERCKQTVNPVPRYILNLLISDATNQAHATAFDSVAEKFLNTKCVDLSKLQQAALLGLFLVSLSSPLFPFFLPTKFCFLPFLPTKFCPCN